MFAPGGNRTHVFWLTRRCSNLLRNRGLLSKADGSVNTCSYMRSEDKRGRITEGDLSSKRVKLGSLNRAVAEAVLQKPTKLNSGLNRPLFKPEIQTTSDHGLVAT